MAISDGKEDIFLSFCNDHEKWRAIVTTHDVISPSPPIIKNLLPYPLLFPLLRIVIVYHADKYEEGPKGQGG